ncbi:Polymer-forming protein [Paucidesulfovibrio gracilis DSM 16080]|uniref:Polymer-forming protein n=1 Tax=Paucidesulfovibrio gracilis DSM 16080 TaxID=1121449 RepID=A0A1T4WNV4_9BACT|nr:polymer-forming cytoskeletal protein [Paucidesulfovibrio gracilis]SKA79024.1 Polymer-forming protein [Paucidesulfovibrio gracilis DSM 16080]
MKKHDALCILGKGSQWKGLLEFEGSGTIDSFFEGDIRTRGLLTIGPNGKVAGSLQVGELEVYGKVEGDVQAERKVLLRDGATLTGNIDSPCLASEEGASFTGKLNMLSGKGSPRARRTMLVRPAPALPKEAERHLSDVAS